MADLAGTTGTIVRWRPPHLAASFIWHRSRRDGPGLGLNAGGHRGRSVSSHGASDTANGMMRARFLTERQQIVSSRTQVPLACSSSQLRCSDWDHSSSRGLYGPRQQQATMPLTLRKIGLDEYTVHEDRQLVGHIRYASERSPAFWLWTCIVTLPGPPFG